ncbi:hypothetical protein JCM21900_002705 [Sporobolomyces salmonicolor]
MISLRIRSPSGLSSLQLPSDATLKDLRAKIEETAGIASTRQELRMGFPPKPLDTSAGPDASLSSLSFRTGETIVVTESSALAPASAAPATSGSTSVAASVPQKRTISPSAVPSARRAPTLMPVAAPQPAPSTSAPAFVEVDGSYLVLRTVPDDNSCLFTAVGLVLNPGETNTSASLRKVVAGAIQDDPDTWSEVVLGRSPTEYISTILKSSSWGGAIELSIFSQHFATEIWSIDVQTGRVDKFGEGQGFRNFVLLVYSGIHYDALTRSFAPPEPASTFPPPNLEFDTTVFAKSDEHLVILTAALELVAKLRASHAYTDTATFTLKCEICKEALIGEKEARRHAEKTGHTRFGEYDS